jgi:hypothetical protein
MTPAAEDDFERGEKLPLWRLIAAVAVLGGMAAVLVALTPAYVDNLKLEGYVRELARQPNMASTPDEALRSQIVARAHQLTLPVAPGDIQITRSAGKVELQLKYAVAMDFALYQVDLHFRSSATSQ